MKKVIAGLAVALTLGATPVFAENNGYYVEAAYGLVNIEDTSDSNMGTWKPTLARITVGNNIAENWAIEGIITQGLSSDTVTVLSTVDVKLESKTSYGIAVRPFYKATDSLEIFGRIGWIKNNFTGTSTSSTNYTYNQYFWSVGSAYKITDNTSITLDYSKFQNYADLDANVTMTAIGVRYSF